MVSIYKNSRHNKKHSLKIIFNDCRHILVKNKILWYNKEKGKNWNEIDITADNLSKLTLDELRELNENINDIFTELTEEEKERAWASMNTGIYDEEGNLIGDKFEEEGAYEEI